MNVIREKVAHLEGLDALEVLRDVLGAAKDEQYVQSSYYTNYGAPFQGKTLWDYVNHCGTEACAAGWACATFDGLSSDEGRQSRPERTIEFFGITSEEDNYLFSGSDGVRSHAEYLGLPHYMNEMSSREAARARIAKVLERHGRPVLY
jgi:hypothetical protein